jgi:hypothetical protein
MYLPFEYRNEYVPNEVNNDEELVAWLNTLGREGWGVCSFKDGGFLFARAEVPSFLSQSALPTGYTFYDVAPYDGETPCQQR